MVGMERSEALELGRAASALAVIEVDDGYLNVLACFDTRSACVERERYRERSARSVEVLEGENDGDEVGGAGS